MPLRIMTRAPWSPPLRAITRSGTGSRPLAAVLVAAAALGAGALDAAPGALEPFGLEGRVVTSLGVYGSLTRVIADGVRIGVPNKTANWGLRYRNRRFNFQINGTWQAASRLGTLADTATTNNTGIRWLAPREIWGISAGYKLTKRFELLLSGRNIFNAPSIQYSNVPGRIYLYDVYGSLWNLGIKGTF